MKKDQIYDDGLIDQIKIQLDTKHDRPIIQSKILGNYIVGNEW